VEVLNTQKSDEIQINRKRLRLIIKTILLCGRQGLARRGGENWGKLTFIEPVQNDRNFRTLLRYQMKDVPIMKNVFKEIVGNVQLCSSRNQNELVEICGLFTTENVIHRVMSLELGFDGLEQDR